MLRWKFQVWVMLLSVSFQSRLVESINPHIIFILADDLGWNDVGFHGSNQIPTPNIDALAFSGIILNNYYVTPICTPSRSALMTGKYPIHTGMQHHVIIGSEPWGLSPEEKILPQYLKDAGYATHIVGKWHLGHFKHDYLPESRGFDHHYGYWTGHQDYYDHTAEERFGYWGYDMRRSMNISWEDYGHYSTDLFTKEAVQVIENHDKAKPLFLYLAHLATHSANGYSPLQAPLETVKKFEYIKNNERRFFAGMLAKLDESIGNVTAALSAANMLDNCVIVFSTDNGGPAAGFDLNAASNWPLRGVKDTLWEGGVRGAGFIWSPVLPSSKVSNSLIHITDWLPTLLFLTNSTNTLTDIDGVNVWKSLSDNTPSPRNEILLNIDTKRKIAALRHQNWKLKIGNAGSWNGWYGPSGRNISYNWDALYNSTVAKVIKHIKLVPNKGKVKKIRSAAQVVCVLKENNNNDINDQVYLFDLDKDPCEQQNLASQFPEMVSSMEQKVRVYLKTVVTPRNKPIDPRSHPKYWGYAWINWMDYVQK